MENLMISANAVLPMCLVMALGYGTRRLGWLRREEISTINKIAFRIFLPCLLYYNIYCSDLSGSFDPLLMAYAVGGVLLTFGLALGYTLLTEKLPERRGVLIQGMFRSNYVIMGIPVATALLGADQLGTVSILIAVIVPLFNMLAVVVLEVFRGQKPKPLHILGQIAKNPLVIGSVLGILTLVAGIRLPHILEQTIQSVSAIASPLQLFLLGAFFQFSGLKTYRRELVTVSIAKLIVSPGLFLGLGALLGFRGVAFVSLIGIFASPTAVNSFTMAQQMGGDAELAGDIVVTTSAASILTMFFWISFFQFSGLKTYRRELVTVSIAKLIVSPGLFLGLGALLGFRGVAFVSLIGIFASPTAVNSFTMAQQMGGDAELAGDIVVTTSAASILTMFFWIFLFKSLGMF